MHLYRRIPPAAQDALAADAADDAQAEPLVKPASDAEVSTADAAATGLPKSEANGANAAKPDASPSKEPASKMSPPAGVDPVQTAGETGDGNGASSAPSTSSATHNGEAVSICLRVTLRAASVFICTLTYVQYLVCPCGHLGFFPLLLPHVRLSTVPATNHVIYVAARTTHIRCYCPFLRCGADLRTMDLLPVTGTASV